jgi:hypothetical protein
VRADRQSAILTVGSWDQRGGVEALREGEAIPTGIEPALAGRQPAVVSHWTTGPGTARKNGTEKRAPARANDGICTRTPTMARSGAAVEHYIRGESDPDGNRTRIDRLRTGLPEPLADRVIGGVAAVPTGVEPVRADRQSAILPLDHGTSGRAGDGICTRTNGVGHHAAAVTSRPRE